MMVLKCPGDDLRGGSAAGIYQHDDWPALCRVTGARMVAFDVALPAASLRNDLALVEERVGEAHRLVEQPAGVRPEVEHIAERRSAKLLFDRRDRGKRRLRGRLVEAVDVEDADPILDL